MKINKLLYSCLFVWLVAFSASGQDYSAVAGFAGPSAVADTMVSVQDSISDSEIANRLQVIQKMLNHNEKAAMGWWYSWIGIYGGLTLGFGADACLTNDIRTREDMIVNAGTSLLGFAGQLIAPVKSGYDDELFSKSSTLSKQESLEKLKQAEQMLKYQAERAKSGKSWQIHAINGAVNLAGGLVTWLGYKRTAVDGVVCFAIGMAVSEIQIWSQPTRAMKDYKQYCSKYDLSGNEQTTRPQFIWYAHVSPGGISVGLGF